MGLKDFPSFNTEAAARRELVRQGFIVSEKSISGNVRVEHSVTGSHAFVHLSTLTRDGKTPYPVLRKLMAIGFVPPAEHNARLREAKKVAKDTSPPAEQPIEVPLSEAVAWVNDPKRRYPCELCAVERCAKCVDAEQPCAFPMPVNLGRHKTATHGEAGRAPSRKPRSTKAGPVRVRTDPEVIRDQFVRLSKRLLKQLNDLSITIGEVSAALAERQQELDELRRFKKEIEDAAGGLYDITTRPRTKP